LERQVFGRAHKGEGGRDEHEEQPLPVVFVEGERDFCSLISC
jgi:hypothetical protein